MFRSVTGGKNIMATSRPQTNNTEKNCRKQHKLLNGKVSVNNWEICENLSPSASNAFNFT